MSPTAPGGNVGEHEWFQFGAGEGCGTGLVTQKNGMKDHLIKAGRWGECDNIVPKMEGKQEMVMIKSD